MTSLLRAESSAFIYAQTLDNSGDSEYWRFDVGSLGAQRIDLRDPKRKAVRDVLDTVQAEATARLIGVDLLYRRQRSGAYVITVKPVTLDKDGRISPVLVVFPDLKVMRLLGQRTLLTIESDLGRHFSEQTRHGIDRFSRILTWPLYLVRIYLFICSRRVKYD
jgi:hypothetical protein